MKLADAITAAGAGTVTNAEVLGSGVTNYVVRLTKSDGTTEELTTLTGNLPDPKGIAYFANVGLAQTAAQSILDAIATFLAG